MKLTSNTLFNIAKHTNKTLKLADYVVKAKRDLFYNKLARLEADINEVELIEAFHDDLKDTINKIIDIHSLLSTVDEKGDVLHLVGEKNLSNVFGEAYDKEYQTLDLPFTKVYLHRELDKESLKYAITNKLFGFKSTEYDQFYKQRKNTFKLSETELYEDDEKIEFLASLKLRKKYQPIVNKIKGFINNNIEFRKALSLDDKNLIDKEITFDKSMVDSVAQSSLYISKKDGVLQWGSGFKTKYKKEVNNLIEALKDNPYVEAIEIDKDTSPEAFLSFMNQIKETKFNLSSPVILKSRKLGVYRANGLYFSSEHIVAVDVKDPSAAIHEMIHAVDLANPDIMHSKARYHIARALRSRIDKDELRATVPKSKIGYYLSTEEIIARVGEIAYIFEKFDYNPDKENYSDFSQRVKEEQVLTNVHDLNLVKNISKYETNTNIYCDFTSMNKEMVDTLRDYYKSYYRIDHTQKLDIAPKEVILPERAPHKVIRESERYQKTALSGIQSDTLVELLEYNEKNNTIDPAIFIKKFITDSTNIGRTTKAVYEDVLADQDKCFEVLCEWAFENKKFYEMSRIIEGFYQTNKGVDIEALGMIDYLKENKDFTLKLDYRDNIQEYKEVSRNLHEKRMTAYNAIMNQDIISSDYQNTISEVQDKYRENYIKTILAPIKTYDTLYSKTPLYQTLLKQQKDSNFRERKFSIKRHSSIIKMISETLQRDGNEIGNYFSKDDIAPKAAILTESKVYDREQRRAERFYGKADGYYDIESLKDVMKQVLKATDEYKDLFEMHDRVELKMTRGHYAVYNCYTMDESFMKNMVENIEQNPLIRGAEDNFNLKESFCNNESDLKVLQESIPTLTNYNEKQADVHAFKDSFEYKTITRAETVTKPIEPTLDDVPDLVIEIVDKLSHKIKPEEVKKLTEGLKLEDVDNSLPIDPNPEMKETKKKGRKKKVDPNQNKLW